MKRSSTASEFTRFVLIGLANTVNYYAFYLVLLLLGAPYLASHIAGFLVAFVISFFLNCLIVYRVRPTLGKFLKFPLTQVVNMGLQTLLLYLLVDHFGWNEMLAPLPVLVITVPVTYGVTKWVLIEKGDR